METESDVEVGLWDAALGSLLLRVRERFGRVEPRRHMRDYVRGLLGPVGRKNSRQRAAGRACGPSPRVTQVRRRPARRSGRRSGPEPVVGRKVDLGGQSAAGPADGMVVRLAGRGPFLRAPAAC